MAKYSFSNSMKMKNLLKSLKTPQSSAGYTLTELLIAASATLVVVGAASFGLFSILQGNTATKTQVEIRKGFHRGLDFISDEVRRAKTIDSDASGILGFDPKDKTVVMVLNIPGDKNAIYYLKSNAGTDWLGPQVLYRWGPPFKEDGSYGTGKNTSEALIDQVDGTASNPSCQTGWSASPSSGATGFYACIDPDEKMAQLYLNAKFKPDDSDPYQATTNVFARAEDKPGDYTPPSMISAAIPPSTSSSCGGVSCWTFKVIGANYACNSSIMWDVKTRSSSRICWNGCNLYLLSCV